MSSQNNDDNEIISMIRTLTINDWEQPVHEDLKRMCGGNAMLTTVLSMKEEDLREIADLQSQLSERNDELSALRANKFFSGKEIKPMGTGSTTTEEELKLRLPRDNRDVAEKGARLTHPFYRRFLEIVDSCYTRLQEVRGEVSTFVKCYNACFDGKPTEGITRWKNAKGQIESCPEPVISSIVGGAINRFLFNWRSCSKTEDSIDLLWCSEVEMKVEVDGKEKSPRSDGVLCIVEDSGLRGIVCEENKIGRFSDNGERQAYANAIDILSQKEAGAPMMPVASLRVSFNGRGDISFQLFGLLPTTDEKTLASVKLWEGKTIDRYLACIAALAEAAPECRDRDNAVTTKWGSFHGNLAMCPDGYVYKLFPNESCRQPNMELVRKFVDDKAEEKEITGGVVVKMRLVGSVCGEEPIPARRFAAISQQLEQLHQMDYVHCDIRFHNLLLEPNEGDDARIIDFDVARKIGNNYLSNLLAIVDGKRHPDVANAIQRKSLHELCVQKEHDWHSLYQVMDLFQVTDEIHGQAWKDALESTRNQAVVPSTKLKFQVILKDEAKGRVWPQQSLADKTRTVQATGPPNNEGK